MTTDNNNTQPTADLHAQYRLSLLKELHERLRFFRDNIQQSLRANGNNPDDALAVEIAVDRLIAEANGTWVGRTSVESQETRDESREPEVWLTANS